MNVNTDQLFDDYTAFRAAMGLVESRSDIPGAIEVLIDISFNAQDLRLRAWAGQFLRIRMNAAIVEDGYEATGGITAIH
jgi:hypothetical protein